MFPRLTWLLAGFPDPLGPPPAASFYREVALHTRTQYLSEAERQLLVAMCTRAQASLAAIRTGDAAQDNRAFRAAWTVRDLLGKLNATHTRVLVERRL